MEDEQWVVFSAATNLIDKSPYSMEYMQTAFCGECSPHRPPVVKDTTSQGLHLMIGEVHLLKSIYSGAAKAWGLPTGEWTSGLFKCQKQIDRMSLYI